MCFGDKFDMQKMGDRDDSSIYLDTSILLRLGVTFRKKGFGFVKLGTCKGIFNS